MGTAGDPSMTSFGCSWRDWLGLALSLSLPEGVPGSFSPVPLYKSSCQLIEASKWLLDFRAVFLFCDFFFQKDKFFAFTYPEFILRISKPCHVSIPVLVEILLSILTPQEHLKARNVMDRLPWPEGMSFYKHRAQRCSCPAFTPPSRVSMQGLS